jgi:hypothetical protein
MREQQPAVAEPAARAVVAEPGPTVSPAQAQILMLQRHAGNRAVGRLLRARRLQRDDLESPVPLDDK